MAKGGAAEFQRGLAGFVRALAPATEAGIRGNTRLFESGIMDSYKVLELIAYVENELHVRIPDEEITLENFRSIKAITNAFWKRAESRG